MQVVFGQLKDDIQTYQLERSRRHEQPYGRAALWHVFRRFQLDYGAALAVDYQNLISLQMHGDLAGFMNSWDNCLMATSQPPDDHMLRALLDPQLRKRRAL